MSGKQCRSWLNIVFWCLIWIYVVCSDLSVPILKYNMVYLCWISSPAVLVCQDFTDCIPASDVHVWTSIINSFIPLQGPNPSSNNTRQSAEELSKISQAVSLPQILSYWYFYTIAGTQPQQQQIQDQSAEELSKIAQAVSLPQIFGDERDAVIAKWNQIQALWGTGKGYYYQNQFVEFKPTNPFCRFKVRTDRLFNP